MTKPKVTNSLSSAKERLLLFVRSVQQYPDNYGKHTRLAVERYLKDIEANLYVFDWEKVERVVSFIEKLNQSKGRWARKPLKLEPWQIFFLGNVFGFLDNEGHRRFRVAYLSIGRKNGKSTLISGILLYLLLADKEASAEIFCGANSREQASIVYKQIAETIAITPGLSKYLKSQTHAIINPATFGSIKKISSESHSLDGLNVHACVLDEIHEFRNDSVWNVIRGGMGSRTQPILIGITTAGLSKDHFGFQQESYTKQVLELTHNDDNYFGMIFSIDDNDLPEDSTKWIKANPNLGVSLSLKDLESQFNEAKALPQKMNDFVAKRLNRYTNNKSGWLTSEMWEKNYVDIDESKLEGEPCFVGLDLSKRGDFTAYSLTFPTLNNFTMWRYFLPTENFKRRVEFENSNYEIWVNDKFLTLTAGTVINQDEVRDSVLADSKRFKIVELSYDSWSSTNIIKELESEGINCIAFNQGMKMMSPSSIVFEQNLQSSKIGIQRNPISYWMAGNVEIYTDSSGNIKPQKGDDPRKRIDGIVCAIMSVSRASLFNEKELQIEDTVTELVFV